MDISYHAYMYTNTMRSGSGFGSISSFINYKNLFNKIKSLLRLAPFFFMVIYSTHTCRQLRSWTLSSSSWPYPAACST